MSRASIRDLYAALTDSSKDNFIASACFYFNIVPVEEDLNEPNWSAIDHMATLELIQREIDSKPENYYSVRIYDIIVDLLVRCQDPVDINSDIVQMAQIYSPDSTTANWAAIREEAIEQNR